MYIFDVNQLKIIDLVTHIGLRPNFCVELVEIPQESKSGPSQSGHAGTRQH